MNKKDCYNHGYNHGYNAVTWGERLEFGQTLPRQIDWQGIESIETAEDFRDAIEMMAFEAEMGARDYSPFEFFAKDVNDSHDPEGLWEAYDNGVASGIRAAIRKEYPLKELRKEEREYQNSDVVA